MTKQNPRNHTQTNIAEKINQIKSEYYFDTQTMPGMSKVSSIVDETYLIKVLTKLAVGTATVWWSAMEIKEIISLYKKSRKKSF